MNFDNVYITLDKEIKKMLFDTILDNYVNGVVSKQEFNDWMNFQRHRYFMIGWSSHQTFQKKLDEDNQTFQKILDENKTLDKG